MEYREVAKKFKVTYLFGRWGINFLPRDPHGKIHSLFTIIPLDGWTEDTQEILQAMFDDPDFDVVFKRTEL